MNYVDQLRQLATTKGTGWQQSDCPVVRTSTLETQKAWKSVLSETKENEEELFKKCQLAIEAQARYRREARNTNQHVPQPKMLSAWLRAGRWDEEIPSHAELKISQPPEVCTEQGCSDFVHVSGLCAYHYCQKVPYSPNSVAFKDVREAALRMSKGETREDYIERCKHHCRGYIK